MIQKVIELIEEDKSHYFLQENDTFKSVKFDSESHKVSGRILLTNERISGLSSITKISLCI